MAPLAVAVSLAAVCTTLTSVLVFLRRRDTPAALPLTLALVSVTVWAGAVVAESLLPPRPWPYLLDLPLYLGVGGTVVSLRLFADAVQGRPIRRRRVGLLLVEPVLLLVLIALDPHLRVFHSYVGYERDGVRILTYGPAFWVHTIYSYAVVLSVSVDLWRLRQHTSKLLRRQVNTMLAAIAVPFATNVLVITLLPSDCFAIDVTPLTFVMTGLLFAYAVLYQTLLRLVPVARSLVVDSITDAVLVVDPRQRLVDHNPAALAGLVTAVVPPGRHVLGHDFRSTVDPLLADAVGDDEGECVVRLADGTSLDVRTRWIRDDRHRPLGRLVVARDVTAQLAAARALEEANTALREKVATIDALQAELVAEAAKDPLTGLRNRRRFVEDFGDRLAAAAQAGEPTSIVLLDIDHFKSVNDTYGHAVGDEVLVAVAAALRTHARAGDVVRYGGEEFVVMFPQVDAAGALRRADALRQAFEGVRVGAEGLRITISAGVATSPDHGGTPDELLLAADRALYQAKETGRNRTIAAL